MRRWERQRWLLKWFTVALVVYSVMMIAAIAGMVIGLLLR